MKFFFLSTLGEVDGERAVIDTPPRALGMEYTRPADGERVGEELATKMEIVMSKQYRGVKLDSLVGNTLSYLIVKQAVQDVIDEHRGRATIEYIPFTLVNQKKRVQSKELVIVNPIGVRDCLDLEKSEIKYLDEPGDPHHGSVVRVKKFVLDPDKVAKAPALFRIKEAPSKYVINEALAAAFKEHAFTNMELKEIDQRRSKGK